MLTSHSALRRCLEFLVNSYQYTGRENDGTGLYFYRARYYAPALGRFISEDPIGLEAESTGMPCLGIAR